MFALLSYVLPYSKCFKVAVSGILFMASSTYTFFFYPGTGKQMTHNAGGEGL